MYRLTTQLREQPQYRVRVDEIRLSPPPPHVPRTTLTDALAEAGLIEAAAGTSLPDAPPESFSLLEPNLAERLHNGLAAQPWIAEVEEVRIDRSGVQLRLTYRWPALAVATTAGRYLVSGEGVLLPSASAARLDLDRLPLLLGDRRPPLTAAGLRWRDSEVFAAAGLARALTGTPVSAASQQSLWEAGEFVSLQAEGEGWRLNTRGGSHVVWGTAGDVATEPTPDQKARRLADLLQTRGSLAGHGGPYRIDLTRWDVTTLEPLPAARLR